MIKRLLSVVVLAVALLGVTNKVAAQTGTDYTNAVGMAIDLGSDYGTFVGISGKHFFDKTNAGEAQVLFGNSTVMVNLQYQYHAEIPNAAGLKWYAGLGPGIAFQKKYYHYYGDYSSGGTDILIRPTVGLDYKVNNVPLNFSFDWRPAFVVTHGTDFSAARFGLGFRYAF